MKKALIFTFLIFLSLVSWNKENFEGEITYKISYKNLPEEMGMMKAMLPKKTRIIIKDEWSKISQNMGIMGKTQIINNSKTKKTIMLMNVLGKKIAMEMEDTNSHKPSASIFKVIKENTVKIIAGYKCKKVTITDTSENKIILWTTNELPAYQNQNLPDVEIGGFPMEYSMEQNDMRIRMTASKVKAKKIDDKEFKIPKGYEMKTPEEMGELMKGMNFGK